ncbi:TVG0368053 [Thermoplasma volcanium GSS1]|uniref:TVG0368053 protein n=1 Tax=Thermoplasma volcanium (strain ATCC 51530 / DSM 4299 / JCM 9571 / NBRC 15438 / GSS1) TaxID=273116 RepID=Q97BS6_THEVO|nr:hypothetical protein [Thermoplasma volcanium]BAB59521.1 TVG0368053 [Thermoplasma volcanium GSS1]
MDRYSLKLYYASMIVYIFGSITLILYTLIIKPIALMYHEPINQMVSPVFGNYARYLFSLELFTMIIMVVSLILFLLSIYHNHIRNGKISKPTIITPVLLFAFAFVLLGVSGF